MAIMGKPEDGAPPGARDRELELLGLMARSCAHDFNNFLGAIEVYVVLSQRALPVDGQLWKDLGEIRKILARAAGVTRQMSLFGRRKPPPSVLITAEELCSRLEDALAGPEAGVRLSVEKGRGLPAVSGDPGQLVQALCAAVRNAVEAAGPGGTVSVRAERAADGPARPPCLKISVSDSGPGFSAEALERLFEPFFTTRRTEAGKGLGLAAAYGIIRSHGGRLEAANRPGGGALVSVFLPGAEAAGGETPRE